jgi:hypothetical protein
MIFTVEIKDVDKASQGMAKVEIFLDCQGLQELVTQLGHLKTHGDHIHLLTESWGGGPLTEDKQVSANALVHHLRITYLQLRKGQV